MCGSSTRRARGIGIGRRCRWTEDNGWPDRATPLLAVRAGQDRIQSRHDWGRASPGKPAEAAQAQAAFWHCEHARQVGTSAKVGRVAVGIDNHTGRERRCRRRPARSSTNGTAADSMRTRWGDSCRTRAAIFVVDADHGRNRRGLLASKICLGGNIARTVAVAIRRMVGA